MDLSEQQILSALRANPDATLEYAFGRRREFLKNVIARRLDTRLVGRVDPSDLVQETLIEAYRRLDSYLANPTIPFLQWLTMLADQAAKTAHRRHVRAERRSIDREEKLGEEVAAGERIQRTDEPETDPVLRLLSRERRQRLLRAIGMLSEESQQLIRMRFIEERSLNEISETLGISVQAASKRTIRSLQRLRKVAGQIGLNDSNSDTPATENPNPKSSE